MMILYHQNAKTHFIIYSGHIVYISRFVILCEGLHAVEDPYAPGSLLLTVLGRCFWCNSYFMFIGEGVSIVFRILLFVIYM